jgi:phospholipid/cholesterol/gamma-HCH transport system substrate-binding protein
MKVVETRLTTTLDVVTTTVNNIDDLVVGLKQGRGAIGMLLRDEKTAADIRTAIGNMRDATSSLNHASSQVDALVSDLQSRGLGAKVDGMMGKADAIVSDLQSRNFGAKIDQTMKSVNSAAHNIDITTQQLQGTIAKALAPDAQGRDAGDNIRETLSNVNVTVANMADDTEALKRGFLFRGFFKKRGYYSIARLNPDKYRKDKTFANAKNRRVWFEAAELFETKPGEGEVLSRAGRAKVDVAMAEFGEHVIGGAIVVEGYAVSKESGGELELSRGRATLVRNYIHERFQLDSQNIGIVPLRGVPPPSTQKHSWNGICLVLVSQA